MYIENSKKKNNHPAFRLIRQKYYYKYINESAGGLTRRAEEYPSDGFTTYNINI